MEAKAVPGAAASADMDSPEEYKDEYKLRTLTTIPFWGVHVAAVVGVIMLGWSWTGLALAIALYYVRMFGITAGFHRYFAHRSYKTGRVMQFLLALLGTLAAQKGALWWAAHHRAHHKYSDQPEDVHSPVQRSFFWSHVGWILAHKYIPVDWDRIPDLAKYPELRFLHRFDMVIVVAFAVALYFIGGPFALVWGFFVSTTLLWHGTFTINSFSHMFGSRRYDTTDQSRNNWLLAILTLGEGWHNNHHYYQRSASQGFYWWEIDISFYILKVMSWLRLIHDLKTVPDHVRDPELARQRQARKRDRELAEVAQPAGAAQVTAPAGGSTSTIVAARAE